MSNPPISHPFSDNSSHPIDQIQMVVDDVETFLSDWIRRLEHLNATPSQPDANLESEMREFHEQKSKWEAKRARETEEIGAKAEELTQAWLRLEQEQRRYLQSRGSQSHATHNAASTNEPDDVGKFDANECPSASADLQVATVRVESTGVAPQPALKTTESVDSVEPTGRRRSPLQGNLAGAGAVRQFEQLRQEIQSNRQPHRQV